MVKVTKSTILEAPIDRVWALIRDFNGHDRWHPAAVVGWVSAGTMKLDHVEPDPRVTQHELARAALGYALRANPTYVDAGPERLRPW